MPGRRRRRRTLRGPLTLTASTLALVLTGAASLHALATVAFPRPDTVVARVAERPLATASPDPTPSRSYATPTPRPRHSRVSRTREPTPTSRRTFAVELSPKRWRVIAAARSQLGDPYVYGGTGPDGWDCSGIIQWAFATVGLYLPRVSSDQARMGRATSVWNLNPGDLVAWNGHIALWLGQGLILEAQRPGTTVHVRSFGSQGWWDDSAWGVALDYSTL